jgi:hypothetical protein
LHIICGNCISIESNGGKGLLRAYDNSLFKALSEAYPEHKFLPWKFAPVDQGFWQVSDTTRESMNASYSITIESPIQSDISALICQLTKKIRIQETIGNTSIGWLQNYK